MSYRYEQRHIYERTGGRKFEAWDGGETPDGRTLWVLAEESQYGGISSIGYAILRTTRTRTMNWSNIDSFRVRTRTDVVVIYSPGYGRWVVLEPFFWYEGEITTLRKLFAWIAGETWEAHVRMDLYTQARRKGIDSRAISAAEWGDRPAYNMAKLIDAPAHPDKAIEMALALELEPVS